ncbi:hypothetical protein [Salinibaculum salinum]|uniref:hypothetical protein n=1 Tax=Salinibaculum salinum TaxID=3131996 RepID=UPI0030EC3853
MEKEGPMPTDRFQTWSELRDRVHKFSPNVTLHTKGIYYLPQHSKREVFRRWLAVNDLEDADGETDPTDWKIHNNIVDYDDSFREVSTELLGPFDRNQNQNPGEFEAGGVCDLCGEEYTGHYPSHLPCDG